MCELNTNAGETVGGAVISTFQANPSADCLGGTPRSLKMGHALRSVKSALKSGFETSAALAPTENAYVISGATSLGVGTRRALAVLREKQVDPGRLLIRAGLEDVNLEDSGVRVPAVAEARFIELSADATDNPTFGLQLASRGRSNQTGLAFHLLAASPCMREALSLAPQCAQMVNESTRWSLASSPGGDTVVELRYSGMPRQKLRHTTEYQVAAALQHLRDCAGRDFSPVRVSFVHFRTDPTPFERFFRCPVEFGADTDGIVLSARTLDMPCLRADAQLFGILKKFGDELVKTRCIPTPSFSQTVNDELFVRLAKGEATQERIAQALSVSPRTLVRRLTEERTSFSDLLENLRRSLAIQYIQEPEISVDRMALLLGYSDAASFNHAFRRWTGMPPSAARQNRRVRAAHVLQGFRRERRVGAKLLTTLSPV